MPVSRGKSTDWAATINRQGCALAASAQKPWRSTVRYVLPATRPRSASTSALRAAFSASSSAFVRRLVTGASWGWPLRASGEAFAGGSARGPRGSKATMIDGSAPHVGHRSLSVAPRSRRSLCRRRVTSTMCPQYRRTRQRMNSHGGLGGPSSAQRLFQVASDMGGALATCSATHAWVRSVSCCLRWSARVSWY